MFNYATVPTIRVSYGSNVFKGVAMSKENFYDENGDLDSSMVCAARKGDLAMREFLYNNVDKKAYRECVLDLASSKVEGATEAIIKR